MSIRVLFIALTTACVAVSACGEPFTALEPIASAAAGVQVVSPEETQAQRIAEAYIQARDQFDVAAAIALLDPDAIVIDTPFVTASGQAALFDFFKAVDWRWKVTSCDGGRLDGSSGRVSNEAPTPTEIVCGYYSENAWSRAIAAGPITGQFRFAIRDGVITELYHDYDVVTWERDVISVFRAWVAAELPEIDASLWEIESFRRSGDADLDLPRRLVPALTPRAIGAFAQATAAFVEGRPGVSGCGGDEILE